MYHYTPPTSFALSPQPPLDSTITEISERHKVLERSSSIIMSTVIKFEPACPNPRPPITNEMRIKDLKSQLNSERLKSPKGHFMQHAVNLEKLLSMYENGETYSLLILLSQPTYTLHRWLKAFMWARSISNYS